MHKTISHCIVAVLLVMACMLTVVPLVYATEEFAAQTGQKCAVCHLDPTGGGELTVAGKTFAVTRHESTESPAASMFEKAFRLLIGYVHFLTAIFWFGTILYVHLVLKPTYAASGLPRGEVRVGLLSMAIMGISGAILAHYRINSIETLLHTRFGILLLIKVSLYLIMVLSAMFVIIFIGPRLKAKRREPHSGATTGEMTSDDLAACDGKDGRPAYFAFEGTIYDASGSRFWKQGVHMGRHYAGSDLTEALKLAPHGGDKIAVLPSVGSLVADAPRKKALHERVFYVMAYMNLMIVFLIVLILSLWRWG
jgi:predicted heme/steroid binding protein